MTVSSLSYALATMFNMSHIIEFHKLNINLIYAYTIMFLMKSTKDLYFGPS